jgi:hypothetical protein
MSALQICQLESLLPSLGSPATDVCSLGLSNREAAFLSVFQLLSAFKSIIKGVFFPFKGSAAEVRSSVSDSPSKVQGPRSLSRQFASHLKKLVLVSAWSVSKGFCYYLKNLFLGFCLVRCSESLLPKLKRLSHEMNLAFDQF